MNINMPAGLTIDNHTAHRPEGEFRAAFRDGDVYEYDWTLDGETIRLRLDFVARRVEIPDDAPQARIDALIAALAFEQRQAEWSAAAQQIIDLAQSGVGLDIRTLTDNQRWALLAVLLWEHKAINPDLTLRPLAQWVVRRP